MNGVYKYRFFHRCQEFVQFPFKTIIKLSKSNPILKQIDILSCLEALQKNFALVLIDKTSNNFTTVCKWCYV